MTTMWGLSRMTKAGPRGYTNVRNYGGIPRFRAFNRADAVLQALPGIVPGPASVFPSTSPEALYGGAELDDATER